jgi:hypothetical protein
MSTFLILKPEEKYALSIVPEAMEQKRKALADIESITAVTTVDQLQVAALALSTAAGVVKAMETTRTLVKAPILDAGKRIDAMAREFSAPIEAKMAPLRKMVSDFHAAEAARVQRENEERERKEHEAERARLAQESRILQERQDREKKEAEEAAAREVRSKAIPAPSEPEDPFAGLRAIGDEEERTEQSRQATETENARLAQLEADRLASQTQLAKPLMPSKATGVSSRKVWKYEVVDLELFHREYPNMCTLEVMPSKLNYAIAMGLRDCPGLRIYEEVETKVRAK